MQEDFQEGGVAVQFCISNPVNIEGVGGPGLFGQLGNMVFRLIKVLWVKSVC